jgi:hypothetical protein
MRQEPLFIRFVNGQVSAVDIVELFLSSTKHQQSIEIATRLKDKSPDISVFRNDFKNLLMDLIDNGVNQRLINYVNSYMKPSLEEVCESSGGGRAGESQYIFIKAEDTPWVEAIVCYNLCLYIKAYGFRELKLCPVCKKFFSNKGKYAKYCSESCKGNKQ